MERKPSGKWSAFFRIAAVDNSAVVSMVCRKSGASDACFIAAAPATVGRLIKGMVETEAHNRPITKNIEIAFGVWNRLHAFDTEGALHAFGISASDWKLLLERLGEG